MLEALRDFTARGAANGEPYGPMAPLVAIRTAAAQLMVATGAAASLERTRRHAERAPDELHRPLSWAPLAVATLAAAAQLEHARDPSDDTARAVTFLNGATIALGGTLLAYDLLRRGRSAGTRLAPLALASTGLLGFAIDRHEAEMAQAERDLRRRADVVERLVPRRRAKLDRVVVHV